MWLIEWLLEIIGGLVNLIVALFRNLKIFVTIILGMALFVMLSALCVFWSQQDPIIVKIIATFIFLAISAVICGLIFLIVYFWWGKDTKCPSCKKPFSVEKQGEEIINRRETYVPIKTNRWNNDGDVVGTSEQYVPGEIVTYKETFACKKCGHKTYKTHTKSIPNVY